MRAPPPAARRLSPSQQPAGPGLGAVSTGPSVYELPPGQAVSPYHDEDPGEEWLLVVSGTPTSAIQAVKSSSSRGDLVFFPPGPAGAHLVRNTTDATARVAMFSSSSAAGAVVYPDSDHVWMWTGDGAVDLMVERRHAAADAAPWIT